MVEQHLRGDGDTPFLGSGMDASGYAGEVLSDVFGDDMPPQHVPAVPGVLDQHRGGL